VLNTGHLLDNRYRLDERIATGGMGDVWRGTDVVLGRTVAVKVLKPAMLADPEFSARFYGEARMMAAFRHPGVVEVYDYADAGDAADGTRCAYLVMAYVEGEPLSARLKEAGRLGVAETMSIVGQAAEALHVAHENGIVHRDVKPGNLIVKPSGAAILVDFGVARSAAVTSVTGLNAIVGTALYMAPEQVAKGDVTPCTDIYALGAVAYHCIAGRPPFDGDNALQVALRHLEDEPDPLPDDVPAPVRDLIARAMAKDPRARFATAAEFADAALAAIGALDRPVRAGAATAALPTPVARAPVTRTMAAPAPLPVAPPARVPRQPRSQLVVLLTVIALLLLAGGLALAVALRDAAGDTPGGPAGTGPSSAPSSTAPAQLQVPARPPGSHNPHPNGTGVRTTVPTPPAGATRPPTRATTTPPATHATTTPATDPTTPASNVTTTPTGNPPTVGDGAG
jgi:eukaryotic-like serine/threonine-protein kinase